MGLEKVVMIASHGTRRGAGLYFAVHRLSRAVAEAGTTVEALALDDGGPREDLDAWRPVTPRIFPRRGLAALGYSPPLRSALFDAANDNTVLHLHGLWLAISRDCLNVSEKRRAARIISPHGMLDPWALKQGTLRKRLAGFLFEWRNLGQARCLHALGDSEYRSLRALGFKVPIAVIPNGVDLPIERPDVDDPLPSWRGRRVMLFLGRLHPKKGLLPLLEAWKRASIDSAWGLVIAGPDDSGHLAQLSELIQSLRLSDSVSLVGPRHGAEKDRLLRRADVFVLTSHSEGFPMAVLEAMAYGKPSLISGACNFPEAYRAGAAAQGEPDVAQLAPALKEFLSRSPEDLRAMGQKGRALVERDYAWPVVARQMRRVYRWMVEGGDPPIQVRLE